MKKFMYLIVDTFVALSSMPIMALLVCTIFAIMVPITSIVIAFKERIWLTEAFTRACVYFTGFVSRFWEEEEE